MWNTPSAVSTMNLKGSDRRPIVEVLLDNAVSTLNLKGSDRHDGFPFKEGKVVSTTILKGSDREHDVPIFILQAANTLNLKGNDRVLSHQSQTPRILKGSDRQNEDYFLNLEGIDGNRSLYIFFFINWEYFVMI